MWGRWTVVAALAGLLTGCEAPVGGGDGPGTIHAHLNGQTVVQFGASGR